MSSQSNKKPMKILLLSFILLFTFIGWGSDPNPIFGTSNTDNSSIEKPQLLSWDFTSASSSLDSLTTCNYGSNNLSDGAITTTWSEGESGDGIGSWIQLSSDNNFIISKLQLENGYKKSEEALPKK